ncbi:MAG: hypothetical protein ACPK85_02390 [Methanosarcina sp.]
MIQVSALENSPSEEAGTPQITELYSDSESFDVTLYSSQPEEDLTLEAFLIKPSGTNEKLLASQVFPVNFSENPSLMKVGFWDFKNPERGAYTFRARLLEKEKLLSEAEYDFVYGSNSTSRIQVNDLVPNSQEISIVLSPRGGASLFDIQYMLIDNSTVVYLKEVKKQSLTSVPEVFSANWGTLLENNKEYAGRVKIQVYSPEKEFIASAENFTAAEDAEITDIYEDETGASATVFGRSQVPFEGTLRFSVYELGNSSQEKPSLIESSQVKVPVLLNDDDETVEVAWSQRLTKGIYKLEIELLGNNGDIIERRETIIESDLSPGSNTSAINNSRNDTTSEEEDNGIPGFSLIAGIAGIAGIAFIAVFLRKRKDKQN